MTRRLVIISGAPGAGKTTLAVPLAAALGFPLFSKDHIKEVLTERLGDGGGDLSASRRLGGAAMDLLWSLAGQTPTAVLEANFRPKSDYERDRLAGLEARIVEIHCDCGWTETQRRFADRASRAGHHPAHPLKALTPDLLAEYDGPIGIGLVLKVDTRAPVNVQALASRIGASWAT
jgi:predicted kinase